MTTEKPDTVSLSQPTYLSKVILLEREAYQLREAGQIEKAFAAYDEAARLYREHGEHLKAAVCFSAAATCWNIHTGWQPLSQAASRNHFAAEEAMKAKNYDYARSLFRDAALLYEREGDYENYSVCFTQSQRAGRKRAWVLCFGKAEEFGNRLSFNERVCNLNRWFFNIASDLIWGYGEHPLRTLGAVGFVALCCAMVYRFSGLTTVLGVPQQISFFDALYLSVMTLTTVGYGDYLPTGWVKMVAMLESLCGIFLAPLFLVGLTRRFLRMYR